MKRATWRFRTAACIAAVLALPAVPTAAPAQPLNLTDYMALSGPEPSARIAYGPAPSQYVEFFQPAGSGPFPVAVLVHGGCWQAALQGMPQLRDMAGALVAQGIAVWSVEYRRVDEDGGGYPGTYDDMIAALDTLGASTAAYQLDAGRIVAVGHSAGGHLVRWAAGRARLPTTSPLYRPLPLPLPQVISLGGVGNDLAQEAEPLKKGCGLELASLTGQPTAGRPDVLADTNPAALLPTGSHTLLVHGELDRLSPPSSATAVAEAIRASGDSVDVLVLPGASHFDEVSTRGPAWPLVMAAIQKALLPVFPALPALPGTQALRLPSGGSSQRSQDHVALPLLLIPAGDGRRNPPS